MKNALLVSLALIFVAACSGGEADTLAPVSLEQAKAEATVTLDAYYAAAADADFDRWIAQFTEDARFYGTDATEDWPHAEFAEGVKEGFAAGRGWDFDILDRRVTVSPDGQTAWFAELAHFNPTDYTLRPSGVLINEDGNWKISQLIMGVPFPNDIYDPMRMALQAARTGVEVETEAVNEALDRLHTLASGGDLDAYMAVYTEDAMFFGTDETERWTMPELRAYAETPFSDGEGWTFTPVERQVVLGPMKNTAWFDEVLTHARYPRTRGSGVLLRTDEGWKVAQYNLTFLIPNDDVEAVGKVINGGRE